MTPFICKTEDGREIYVKPAGVLQESLIAEWIGGRLAQRMELPCAEMTLVDVPAQLAEANEIKEWRDFKAGIGFGSYAVGRDYRDLQASDLPKLPKELLASVYLFDYWIKNEDRKMGILGGNPNTLVSSDVSETSLIDHDNAFDLEFDLDEFKRYHLGATVAEICRGKEFQKEWLELAEAALAQLGDDWDELPESWLHSDLDISNDPSYTIDRYQALLEAPFKDSELFWSELLK